MKQGRERQYNGFSDITAELDYLQELRQRADDLVEDLDEDTLRTEHNGHSIKGLIDHMIGTEVQWFSQLRPSGTAIFPTNLKNLDQYTRLVTAPSQLGDVIEVGPFRSIDEMIRHIQWHWTYHSAQIGMLRRMMDKPYQWNFAAPE